MQVTLANACTGFEDNCFVFKDVESCEVHCMGLQISPILDVLIQMCKRRGCLKLNGVSDEISFDQEGHSRASERGGLECVNRENN